MDALLSISLLKLGNTYISQSSTPVSELLFYSWFSWPKLLEYSMISLTNLQCLHWFLVQRIPGLSRVILADWTGKHFTNMHVISMWKCEVMQPCKWHMLLSIISSSWFVMKWKRNFNQWILFCGLRFFLKISSSFEVSDFIACANL